MSEHVLPEHFKKFKKKYPDIYEAYQALGNACHQSGNLDDSTRRLIKLAMAVAIGSEGAVHSQVRRALEEGLPPEDLQQVALLAIPTIGFPRAMAALSWINDLVER